MSISVLRPSLPNAELILPYLSQIDKNRVYTNFGPLYYELCKRLGIYFDVPCDFIVCTSSGTSALVAAILATAGRATKKKPVAIVPAFTFAATALAAELCGYEVHFMDVSATDWSLEPKIVASFPSLNNVGLIIPVAPFGRPILQRPWLDLQQQLGIPVIFDAAACFETVVKPSAHYMGDIPLAISFHATKSFSTAEGGAVISSDPILMERVTRTINFGLSESRECVYPSFNGKMSEYHAAVGLAELDGWPDKKARFQRVSNLYRELFSAKGLAESLLCFPNTSSSYVLFIAGSGIQAEKIKRALKAANIDFRQWYGKSLNEQCHFSKINGNMPISENLASTIIGLPVATDLGAKQIRQIVDLVHLGSQE